MASMSSSKEVPKKELSSSTPLSSSAGRLLERKGSFFFAFRVLVLEAEQGEEKKEGKGKLEGGGEGEERGRGARRKMSDRAFLRDEVEEGEEEEERRERQLRVNDEEDKKEKEEEEAFAFLYGEKEDSRRRSRRDGDDVVKSRETADEEESILVWPLHRKERETGDESDTKDQGSSFAELTWGRRLSLASSLVRDPVQDTEEGPRRRKAHASIEFSLFPASFSLFSFPPSFSRVRRKKELVQPRLQAPAPTNLEA